MRMALPVPRLVLVLVTLLFAGACDADHPVDPEEDAQPPDGGSDAGAATGGTGGVSGGGRSGASNAGRAGGSSGSGGVSAAGRGGAGASGAGGRAGMGAAGRGGMSATGGTGGAGAGSANCPTGLEGPALVNVPAPSESGVSSYCVDATEVTNAQYAAFLNASGATSEQDAQCAWNMSYTPSSQWPATGKDNYPVTYVDWCDAYAYCKWAGKHLCGKIGGGEGNFAFDYDDARKSEWFNACSAGDTSTYSYGNEYDGTKCVGIDYDMVGYQPGTDVARAVATANCVGGYGGLHDLSGNVWEWENACRGSAMTDPCRMRGGGSSSTTSSLECDTPYDRERNWASPALGFRCCTGAMK
jgi:formylglycine-generating enzyme